MSESNRSRDRHPFDLLANATLWCSLLALALSRVDPTDTAWHLATAREAFRSGAWPLVNTFSFTYTEYPLYQQYPLYQSLLYATYSFFGFEGLSVLSALAFLLSFALLRYWAGPRSGVYVGLLFLALCGMQQRMVLRPVILSFPLLLLLLICFDRYLIAGSRVQRWRACLCILITQYLWILSHQLFIIGVVFQFGLLLSILVSRLRLPGVDTRFASQEIFPLFITLLASILAISCTPLGLDAYTGVAKTFQGLDYLRGHVHELRPLWELPYAATLCLLSLFAYLFAVYRLRAPVSLFSLGLLSVLLVMALVAWRGVIYFVPIAAAVSIRYYEQHAQQTVRQTSALWRVVRTSVVSGFLLLVLVVRWGSDSVPLIGQQPGLGKAIGAWPDEMMQFVKEYPPPGRGLNLTWYLGNALIWDLYPAKQVFVDPRTETYPRDFIESVFEAVKSPEQLERFIKEYDPGWVLFEMRHPELALRATELLEKGWQFAYCDPLSVLLISPEVAASEYRRGHAVSAERCFNTINYSHEPSVALQQRSLVERFREKLLSTRGDSQG